MVDPQNIQHLCKLMNKVTRQKHLRYWSDFVHFSGIHTDILPKKEHFMTFFLDRREVGKYSGKSIWTCYSSINAIYHRLYLCLKENISCLKIKLPKCDVIFSGLN